MARKYVDAHDLKPGDNAKIGPGRYERIVAPTSKADHGCVVVHTDKNDVLTSYPVTVEVDR